jgi:hypothetical protein
MTRALGRRRSRHAHRPQRPGPLVRDAGEATAARDQYADLLRIRKGRLGAGHALTWGASGALAAFATLVEMASTWPSGAHGNREEPMSRRLLGAPRPARGGPTRVSICVFGGASNAMAAPSRETQRR